MVLAVLEVAVVSRACIPEAARHLWVNVHAFFAVAALREEFAFFLRVHVLALSVAFAALGPVLASHVNFFNFGSACFCRLIALENRLESFDRLYWPKALKSFSL